MTETIARSPSKEIQLPSVVVLLDYTDDGGLYGTPACNIITLYERDFRRCQYTGQRVFMNNRNPEVQATIDHVYPKSLGGRVEWLNTVLASSPANNRKGNRTPEQAGLTLRIKPWEPKGADLLYLSLRHNNDATPEDWREFLEPIKPSADLRRVMDTLSFAA